MSLFGDDHRDTANDNANTPGSDAVQNPRILRESLGLSQADLADILAIPVNELRLLERGHGRMSIVVALAMEALSLHAAVTRGDPALAHPGIRKDAVAVARLIGGGRSGATTPPA